MNGSDQHSPGPAPWPARRRVPAVLLLAVAGGVLFGLHVLHSRLAPLGWISTTPWVLLAAHPRLRGRGNAWAFYLGLHVMALVGLTWLRGQNTPTWIVAPCLYLPQMVPAFFLLRWIHARWARLPLTLVWPMVYTGVEWARMRLSPGELALCVLGHSQVIFTKLIQVADLAGVPALTFTCAAVAGLAADVVLSLDGPFDARAHIRRLGACAAAIALLVGAELGYGFTRDTEAHFHDGPTFQVVQTMLPRPLDFETALKIYDVAIMETMSTFRPGQVDAVLWPENSIMAKLYLRGRGFDNYIGPDLFGLSQRWGVPILVDGISGDPESKRDYHTAVWVKPDGSFETYDKVMLLPWTEFVPLRDALQRLSPAACDAWIRFVKTFTGMVPGGTKGTLQALHPFHLRARDGHDYLFGTPICFEVATPRVVSAWDRQGADFLVNQTSEGKLGASIHEQTLTVCGFRAVEGRVSVVRATNDGISAWIDPNGRVREVLHGRETGALSGEPGVFYPTIVTDDRKGTFYVRHGDILPVLCLLLAVPLALVARFGRRRKPAPADPAEVPPALRLLDTPSPDMPSPDAPAPPPTD